MTRIAFVADSHFAEDSRFDECIRIHDWIADDMERRGVDLMIHTGDVYERKSTPRERNAAAAWFARVAANCPIVIVRGNHDFLHDLMILGKLDSRYAIFVEEAAGLHRVHTPDGEYVYVAAVGWPRKAEVLARVSRMTVDVGEQTASEALRNVLRGMGSTMTGERAPRVLAMHAMVRGSLTSVGQPLMGCDFELGLEDLALVGADFYGLGHIHMPQDWFIGEAPVVYPGSPRRTTFGELEVKGYVVAEFEGRKLVKWERVPTPCTPMLLLTGEYVRETTTNYGEDTVCVDAIVLHPREKDLVEDNPGAEIRVRYAVESDEREAGRAAAARLCRFLMEERDAVSVKIEEQVVTTTRARAPEVSQALTLEDKLAALWRLKGFEPGERRERLIGKSRALDEEDRSHAS